MKLLKQHTPSTKGNDINFRTEAHDLAAKLQQDREYLEMFSADDQPELVAKLKASIADSKRQLSNLGIVAA